MNLLHQEGRFMHIYWPSMKILLYWLLTMSIAETKKNKKSFYTNGCQKNWVLQQVFLKLLWISMVYLNHILQNLYIKMYQAKKMRILCAVYKNCNIISAVAFVCKNAIFCKYRILPTQKLAKNLNSFLKFYCLYIQSRIRG